MVSAMAHLLDGKRAYTPYLGTGSSGSVAVSGFRLRWDFDDTSRGHVEQLRALGQEGRLEIFRSLVSARPQGSCVDEIRRRVRMPGSALSLHLDTLARPVVVP